MKKDKMMIEFSVQIKKFMLQTVEALTLIDKKISRLDTILAALLDDMGKSEGINCSKCGDLFTRFLINGLPKENDCPSCKRNPRAESNSKVEDWDKGLFMNEENVVDTD